jgi:heme-degrading monooxygenase HmoA
MPTAIEPFDVPPGADASFIEAWAGAGETGARLYRALRDDADHRYVAIGGDGDYEIVHEHGTPDVEGGVVRIEPFELAPGDDERFLALRAARLEALAGRRGFLGGRLYRGPGDRFVEVASWSSPLMVARAAEALPLPFPSRPALYVPA